MATKYIYSSYEKEFEDTMKILKESGIDKNIEKLTNCAYRLIKDQELDIYQLETYICSKLRYGIHAKIINEPTKIEESIEKEK